MAILLREELLEEAEHIVCNKQKKLKSTNSCCSPAAVGLFSLTTVRERVSIGMADSLLRKHRFTRWLQTEVSTYRWVGRPRVHPPEYPQNSVRGGESGGPRNAKIYSYAVVLQNEAAVMVLVPCRGVLVLSLRYKTFVI